MKIFNTLTRRKEEFKPITPGEVKMYAVSYTHLFPVRFLMFQDCRR